MLEHFATTLVETAVHVCQAYGGGYSSKLVGLVVKVFGLVGCAVQTLKLVRYF